MKKTSTNKKPDILWNTSRMKQIIKNIHYPYPGITAFDIKYDKDFDDPQLSIEDQDKLVSNELLEWRDASISEVGKYSMPFSKMKIEGYIREYVIINTLLGYLRTPKNKEETTKKQHFTPSVYTFGFAENVSKIKNDPYKRKLKLGFLDEVQYGITNNRNSRLIGAQPASQAERFLYSDVLEKTFSVYEGEYGHIISQLFTGDNPITNLSYLDSMKNDIWFRIVLSTFFAIQYMRTPSVLDNLNKKKLPSYLENDKSLALANSITVASSSLARRDWDFIVTEHPLFFTSEPVMLENDIDSTWTIPVGRYLLLKIGPSKKLPESVTPFDITNQSEEDYQQTIDQLFENMLRKKLAAFNNPNDKFDLSNNNKYIKRLPNKNEHFQKTFADLSPTYPSEFLKKHHIQWSQF